MLLLSTITPHQHLIHSIARGGGTFLHKLLAELRLRTEFTRGERELLLRLTVERRVLNERIDEQPHVVLNLRRLQPRTA